MTKIKNLNETSDNVPQSKGYLTWKAFLGSKTGRKFGDCSCKGCIASAAVGTHVQKAGSSDRKWYIVPLSGICNKKGKEEVFKIRNNDLLTVSS